MRASSEGQPRSFQNRGWKAAITRGGHRPHAFTFRRLTIAGAVRFPVARRPKNLIADFQAKGGQLHDPADEEIRTLFALNELLQQNDPRPTAWPMASQAASTRCGSAEVLTSGSLFANGRAPLSLEARPRGERRSRKRQDRIESKLVPVTTPDSRSSVNPPTPQKPASTTRPTAPIRIKPVAPTLDHSVLNCRSTRSSALTATARPAGPPLDAFAKHTVVLAGRRFRQDRAALSSR